MSTPCLSEQEVNDNEELDHMGQIEIVKVDYVSLVRWKDAHCKVVKNVYLDLLSRSVTHVLSGYRNPPSGQRSFSLRRRDITSPSSLRKQEGMYQIKSRILPGLNSYGLLRSFPLW